MQLQYLIERINEVDSDATVWIDGSNFWSVDSRVSIAIECDEGGPPDTVPSGFEYFLEVFIIQELVEDLPKSQSYIELTQRIIDYARDDT